MSVSLFNVHSGTGPDSFFVPEENENKILSPCQSPLKKLREGIKSKDATFVNQVVDDNDVFGNFESFPYPANPSSPFKSISCRARLSFDSPSGIKRKAPAETKVESPNKRIKLNFDSFGEMNQVQTCAQSFLVPAMPKEIPLLPSYVPPSPRKKTTLSLRAPEFPKAPLTPRKGFNKKNDDSLKLQKEIEYQRCLEKYNSMSSDDFLAKLNGSHFTPITPSKQSNEKFVGDKKLLEVSRKSIQVLTNDENRPVEFEAGVLIGKGSFCDVFEINSESPQLYSMYGNESLVFKRFQEAMVLKLGKKSVVVIHSMMEQYEALKNLNAPVIQILNNPSEDKFFIMEKVSMFPITWNETEKPSLIAFKQLDEIRNMIAIAKKHKIDLDLKPSNVGIDANGRVVLFDFREEISEDEDEYLVSINSAIESFSNGNKIVKDYLSSAI